MARALPQDAMTTSMLRMTLCKRYLLHPRLFVDTASVRTATWRMKKYINPSRQQNGFLP